MLPLWVDGDKVGALRRFELLRSSPERVAGVRLVVQLQDSAVAGRLRDCILTIREPHPFGRDGLGCAGSGDSAAHALSRIGEIVLEPAGVVQPLFAPLDQASAWRRYDTGTARADLAKQRAQELAESAARVAIRADSTGAAIDVRGARGEGLLRIQADSQGAVVRIGSPRR